MRRTTQPFVASRLISAAVVCRLSSPCPHTTSTSPSSPRSWRRSSATLPRRWIWCRRCRCLVASASSRRTRPSSTRRGLAPSRRTSSLPTSATWGGLRRRQSFSSWRRRAAHLRLRRPRRLRRHRHRRLRQPRPHRRQLRLWPSRRRRRTRSFRVWRRPIRRRAGA